MKFVELLEKDSKELHELCAELKKEHMNLRFVLKTGQEVKSSAMRSCKKNIARVKTRIRQLELNSK